MHRDDDAEIIAAARVGFLDEAADMLQQFEQALLVMETDPADAENLNAAFRAAHTIKGTAGLFGCDAVVLFTHEVETLLEGLRSGTLAVTEAISAALLEGLDQMAALLDEVRSGDTSPAVAERSQVLGARLRQLYGAPAAPVAAAAAVKPAAAAPASAGAWHLSLRFGPDALRNGLDPLAFIRYLGSLGSITGCAVVADVPALTDLDAETCHLGFELGLQSGASADEIAQVFEFAAEDCSVQILPPGADGSAFEQLLDLRCQGDGAATESLLALWAALGVGMGTVQTEAEAPAEAGAAPAGPATPAPAAPPAPERRSGRDRRGPAEARFVKVRADKLDHLIDLIGELVIAGSGAQMVANQEGSAVFLEATQRVSELVQATRDGALALRMVPVGETFSRFQRVVRDTSKQLGKEIEFVVTGGDTELDKSMVELIADPLMHLVRNSLDHGIELPVEREAAGKPATGRLGIDACHEGGSIVITVSDDGRGLRRERILAKAIERGLLPEGATPSDSEVWQLIFAPGFSTADKVTDLSGRGVGMDVVKRNIEALRGQIALSSTEGQGTRTQIRLPLTLAMIDGFLTLVGGVHYVLPLSVVSECIAVPPECEAAPGRTCGTFDLRGEVLPYIDLALFYGSVATAAGDAEPQRRSLVVVRDGAVRVGLVVDRLLGEHQTVIKPLAGIFRHLQALAGSTILGSGDVALVLDMQGLMAGALQAQQPTRSNPSSPRLAFSE
ncbi:chemotaxis protein CheA [Pseudaquabacterium pictum]|uniref:Chemotaxis protein CheA n=1 Tax=Pseudaquabacterium pictum TaxID=2315236 RepID=A0A480AS36_9BURK|nr:chemotaxis protein CheA [Rubrivivax pictus]GCL63650.1 chemotaxis protein CheA [Rubrivivax pictus]